MTRGGREANSPRCASTRAAIGRAALVHALAEGGERSLHVAARLLGYHEDQPAPEPAAPTSTASKLTEDIPGRQPVAAVRDDLHLFWRPTFVEFYSSERPAPPLAIETLSQDELRGATARADEPEFPLLAPWSRLEPVMRRLAGGTVRPGAVDGECLVERIARGEIVERLPRLRSRAWANRFVVLIDRSPRLAMFRADQDFVRRRLRLLCGRATVEELWLSEAEAPMIAFRRRRPVRAGPLIGERVLVLGDLGLYGGPKDRRAWERLGRQLRAAGNHLGALVPVPSARWSAPAEVWNAVEWDSTRRARSEARARDELDARAIKLLERLSPAFRVQPGLVRTIRRFANENADVGTEYDVWSHEWTRAHVSALSLDPDKRRALLRGFVRDIDASRATKVLAEVRRWHEALPREIWLEEILELVVAGAPERWFTTEELADAWALIGRVDATHEQGAALARAGLGEWFRKYEARGLEVFARARGQAHEAHERMWNRVHEGDAEVRVPPGIERRPPFDPDTPEREVEIRHEGTRLVLAPRSNAIKTVGSPVVTFVATPQVDVQVGAQSKRVQLESSGGDLHHLDAEVSILVTSGTMRVSLEPLRKPAWATAMGRDRYGLWVTFKIKGVAQRMRWIPPGRFIMGSPTSEQGRYNDEGPQHEVIISRGYWLGETPVTQALWEAVTEGENPSEYRSPERPVERVSWDDCQQEFLARINELVSETNGERFALPSEAEWEYACRAGTTAATYAGELEILGESNAPVLDAIAWYSGNSGVDYELEHGYDSSEWAEKQHEHSKAGTHPVKRKQPNQWGLYDMLGNVYELCRDDLRAYNSEQQRNPMGATDTGESRVIRGGSWIVTAGHCRAAYRRASHPGDRIGLLGFRLARGQVRSTGDGPEGP